MQRRLVSDDHVVADDQRVTVWVEGPGVGDVEHGVVLDAAARADTDAVHIAPDYRARPDVAVFSQHHITDDHSGRVDVDALAKLG